jgi:hypothetical protein
MVSACFLDSSCSSAMAAARCLRVMVVKRFLSWPP